MAETETYVIFKHVVQVESRRVTAPKGLTSWQLAEWVEKHGDGDLTDIDELENDFIGAEHEDGSPVKKEME